MYEFVEPHLRRLVAEHLGVGLEVLVSGVTLRDDLAVDSLDLVGLVMVLEGEFAIAMSERTVDEVRTYGDLVHATGLLIRARGLTTGTEPAPRIRVRIVSASGEPTTLERTGLLTPYSAETIADDALYAGDGAQLEVMVTKSTTAGLARIEQQFAGLGRHGIRVTVRHDERNAAAVPSPASTDPGGPAAEVASVAAQ